MDLSNGLSPLAQVGDLEVPSRNGDRHDFARGAPSLGDTNSPRNTLWEMTYQRGKIFLNPKGAQKTLFLSTLASEFAFAFDSNMSPVIVIRLNQNYVLYRYNVSDRSFSMTPLNFNMRTPRMVRDYTDINMRNFADTYLFYFNDNKLCYLSESSNFQQETVMNVMDRDLYLDQVSKNSFDRLQFKVYEKVEPEIANQMTDISWDGKAPTSESVIRNIANDIIAIGDVNELFKQMKLTSSKKSTSMAQLSQATQTFDI